MCEVEREFLIFIGWAVEGKILKVFGKTILMILENFLK